MNKDDYKISNYQAQKIASQIYLDITDYIKKHEKEYKKWKKEQK